MVREPDEHLLAKRKQNSADVRRYRERNPDRCRVTHRVAMRKWRAKNRAKARLFTRNWSRNNPAASKAACERRRARLNGVECTLTTVEWLALIEAWGRRCAYCRGEGRLTKDHVVPISKGGGHTMDNVVPACMPCNAAKGDRELGEFVSEHGL